MRYIAIVFILSGLLTGCVTPPPANMDNACSIFRQYPKWWWATRKAEADWRVPVATQMAIMHQESRFNAEARPARQRLLGFIPWSRPSDSYGYTQAKRATWHRYQQARSKSGATRDDFADSVDFIGWYAKRAWQRAHIAPNDTYHLYLAYHEGIGGYLRHSYQQKPWLKRVASKVNHRAERYQRQLNMCYRDLPRKPWYYFG